MHEKSSASGIVLLLQTIKHEAQRSIMRVRLAVPSEAEYLWFIRNQAIRLGCQQSFDHEVIKAWTPDIMPESYLNMIEENPFFA